MANHTKSASAYLVIVAAAAFSSSISPTSASVRRSAMQLLAAIVTGNSNAAMTWGLSVAGCTGSSCGILSSSAKSSVYAAPFVAPSHATVRLDETRAADPAKSASVNVAIVPRAVVAPPIGINVSGAEYSWGHFAGTKDLAFLKSNNISLIRLPIAWERAQPALLGPLDQKYLSALATFINAAGAQGMNVIVDVHDYGRYNVNWAKDLAAN
ncbi:MAG: cellulase family glycosylhydrolase, partial [Candidatus Acidiferrum sp.]